MKYGDPVQYIKDGKPLSGIVLTANGDLLSILYADPAAESLTFQGNLARIAQVARGVKPLAEGAVFGWTKKSESITNYPKVEYPAYVVKMDDLLNLSHRIIDHAPNLEISPDAVVPSAITLIDDLVKEVAYLKGQLAAKQLDEVQGPVPAGDPESPHAIGGTQGNPSPDGGIFGVGISTSETPVSGGALSTEEPK